MSAEGIGPPPLPPPPFWRTVYFETSREAKPERLLVSYDDIISALANVVRSVHQSDGRLRVWGRDSADRRWVRVILLSDHKTVHNAFRDRRFRQ